MFGLILKCDIMTDIGVFTVYKGPDDDVNFYMKVQNGPMRSHLMVGIAVETTDGTFSDWILFDTAKPSSGDNWSEPNEVVFDTTLTRTAKERGWPDGTYRVYAYVWEAVGEPGHWEASGELDSIIRDNAFDITSPLPDNTQNFSNIVEHDILQGRCLPGVSFDATQQEKEDAFLTSGTPPNVCHPTRVISYDEYGNREEVMITMLRLYNYGKSKDTIIRLKWYRESDGVKLFEFEHIIPPGDYGWYYIVSWIGKASWEISGRGIYRCHVESELQGNINAEAEIYFQVI